MIRLLAGSAMVVLAAGAAIGAGTATGTGTGVATGTGTATTSGMRTATGMRTPTSAGTAPGTRTAPGAGGSDPAAPVAYSAPVPEPLHVVRGFDPPATPYGPGHVGVDIRVPEAATVRSAATGVVTFAGPVAGRGVVVVLHPDGIRTEYEPVRPSVRAGTHIDGGQPIAVVRGSHPGCPGTCLHWGARRGAVYLDPLDLLRRLGPVVLLPWPRDG